MRSNNDLVKEWLLLADHDLGAAKIIFERLPDYKEIVGFHCQQAVEKYLKGLLTHIEIEFNKSHDLIYPVDLVNKNGEIIGYQLKEKTKVLSSFAVNIRYPLGRFDLKLEELKPLIDIADEFRTHINSIIAPK
jgi:HEPN domain-containing protein